MHQCRDHDNVKIFLKTVYSVSNPFQFFRQNKTVDVLDLPFYVLVRCSHFREKKTTKFCESRDTKLNPYLLFSFEHRFLKIVYEGPNYLGLRWQISVNTFKH